MSWHKWVSGEGNRGWQETDEASVFTAVAAEFRDPLGILQLCKDDDGAEVCAAGVVFRWIVDPVNEFPRQIKKG